MTRERESTEIRSRNGNGVIRIIHVLHAWISHIVKSSQIKIGLYKSIAVTSQSFTHIHRVNTVSEVRRKLDVRNGIRKMAKTENGWDDIVLREKLERRGTKYV